MKLEEQVAHKSSPSSTSNTSNSNTGSTVLIDDVTVLRRIKAHLKTCDCCRDAIIQGSSDKDDK